MYFFAESLVNSAYLSLKPLKDALVDSISRPISARGLVGTPILTVLLCFATVLWILAFLLLPMLLTFAWVILRPYRLWVFIKRRMTGTNFSS